MAVDDESYKYQELTRRLEEMVRQLDALSTKLETKYIRDDIFAASKQLSETERSQLDSRITKVESTMTWITRVVGGIVITALMGLIVSGTSSGVIHIP
jgi:hypothetical protein